MIPARSSGRRQGLELPGPLVEIGLVGRRSRREHLRGQHTGEHRVHAAHGVAHAHAAERVAVVAAGHREHPGALGPAAAALGLQHHLQRHLDRHRSGVGEEDLLEPLGRQLDQALGKPDRRLVREPAEHHVRVVVQLRGDGRVEGRVVVAVDRRPPRRHAVDELGAVGQPDAYAVGPRHHPHRRRVGHRGVGVPHVLAVPGEQVSHGAQAFGSAAVPAPRRRLAGSCDVSPSRFWGVGSSAAPSTTKPLSRISSRSASAAWPSEVR